MKFTRYFEMIRLRPDRAKIRLEWIQYAVEHPVREMENRYLRVVLLADGETLYIEFKPDRVVETKDLDENTQVDLDHAGNICAITVEHAKKRADLPHFSFEQVGT